MVLLTMVLLTTLLFAAKVWHYWVAFPLVAGAVLGIVALVVGYLVKVTSAKYPRR